MARPKVGKADSTRQPLRAPAGPTRKQMSEEILQLRAECAQRAEEVHQWRSALEDVMRAFWAEEENFPHSTNPCQAKAMAVGWVRGIEQAQQSIRDQLESFKKDSEADTLCLENQVEVLQDTIIRAIRGC